MNQEILIALISSLGSLCFILQIVAFVSIIVVFLVWQDKKDKKEYFDNLTRKIKCHSCKQTNVIQLKEWWSGQHDENWVDHYYARCPRCETEIRIETHELDKLPKEKK